VKLEKYKSRYISHIALLHVKENKKKRIMPPEAENTKSEVSKWESKVSAQTCMYFVRLAKIVLSHII